MRPSAVAGARIGVFVGASSLDYGNLRILDLSSGDAYSATGNTLSILSNRISYIFDLKRAELHRRHGVLVVARRPKQSGRGDPLAAASTPRSSPASTCLRARSTSSASRKASMLSRTGLCQAFSASTPTAMSALKAAWCSCCNRPRRHGAAVDVRRPDRRVPASIRTGEPPASRCPRGHAQAALLEQHLSARPRSTSTTSPLWKPTAPARRSATRSRPPRSAARSGGAPDRCRSVRSRPISAIPSRPQALPACSRPSWPWSTTSCRPRCIRTNPTPTSRFDEMNLQVAQAALPLARGQRGRALPA